MKTACGITCPAAQECFQPRRAPKVYWAWDRVRLIDSVGSNGTVCFGDGTTKAKAVEDCKAWVTNGRNGDRAVWMDAFSVDQVLKRINLTDCEMLEASIDENCSFNQNTVKAFTTESTANNGDFTISFWVRPLVAPSNAASLHTDSYFYLSLIFLSSVSPPQYNLVFGKWLNARGEARLYTMCGNDFINVETQRSSKDGFYCQEKFCEPTRYVCIYQLC